MNIVSRPLNNTLFSHLLSMLPPVSLRKGAFIAGGCARKLYENRPWIQGDVDVFFAGEWERNWWVNEMKRKVDALPKQNYPRKVSDTFTMSDHILSFQPSVSMKQPPQLPQLSLTMSTDNADSYQLTFVDPADPSMIIESHVQVIKTRYAKSIQDLWQEFDFTVSCFAADANEIWALPQAVEDLKRKKLTLNNDENTKNLVMRVLKHHVYGFEADDQMLLNIADKIVEGDFEWNNNY